MQFCLLLLQADTNNLRVHTWYYSPWQSGVTVQDLARTSTSTGHARTAYLLSARWWLPSCRAPALEHVRGTVVVVIPRTGHVTRATKGARGAVPGRFPDRTSICRLGERRRRWRSARGARAPPALPAATIARVRAGLARCCSLDINSRRPVRSCPGEMVTFSVLRPQMPTRSTNREGIDHIIGISARMHRMEMTSDGAS